MCGIVAVTGYKKALPLLINGLEKLEYRGYDSAGIAIINSETNCISCNKAEGKLKNLINNLNGENIPGTVGIGHTRWATHGKPEVKNAHPHTDSSGNIAVVQNGIIENFQDLKNKLEEEGIIFNSDTDTEVIPHLIQRELNTLSKLNLENNGSTLLVAVRNVISDLEGSYALAVLWSGAPTSLVVARRQAPLIIGLGEGEFICASDTPAIANFTNIILPMEDEEIALLTPLGIEIYDSSNERQYRNPVSLKVSEQIMDKMNFKHYMLKEIYDQPQTAKNWLENYLIKNLDNGQYQINYPFDTEFFESIERIEIIACGTSKHAAMVGSFLLEQFSGIPTNVFYASEFRYSPPPLLPNTLTIGVTQSGETADTIAAIDMEIKRRSSIEDKNLAELITHFILPIATLCLVIAAQLIRMTRAAVLNVMNSPYIEMAILKGIPRRRVVMRHALLNAIGPIVNVIAINLAYVVTGVIVIEVYFGYAGLATLIVQGVQTRDYILIQTLGMIFLRGEAKLPNLDTNNITVTEVRMSPDLKTAKAFVLPLGGKNATEAVNILKVSFF